MQIVPLLHRNRNLVALAAGFLLTGLGWWWLTSVPSSVPHANKFTPASELERIAYASRSARSWRVTTFGTMHGDPFQTDQDVVCPYQSHTVTSIRGKSGSMESEGEEILTKDTLYAREGLDPWSAQPRAPTDQCARGPMAGPGPLVDVLQNLKTITRMEPGSLVAGKESACRVWKFYAGGSPDPVGSICVSETTHLPYELQLGSLHVQYSYWNLPIQVVLPEVDIPKAVPPS